MISCVRQESHFASSGREFPKKSTLVINVSLRETERHFFLPNSFVLCKNTNEHNFVKIGCKGAYGIIIKFN